MEPSATDLLPLQVGHFSDTHLGHEQYPVLSTGGLNQRAVDIVRANSNCVTDLIEWDPPLVIHSGDVFDRSHVPTAYLLEFRRQMERLTALRPDGTRRQVVVISGNHDQPYSRKDPCILELFAGIPGLHIVTVGYQVISFTKEIESGEAAPELANVLVHALPHDELKVVDFDNVHPVEGYTNILTSHGVAGASDLFIRSLGREYPIPADVLGRDWDYVALGHWHKQGPVGLSAAEDKNPNSKIWYAGSPENISFRDLRDNGQRRGYLRVKVNPGQMPEVERQNLPIRSMFRLPVVEAGGMNPEQITAALRANIEDAALRMNGAVVGQIVEGVSHDMWALVDATSVREAAAATGCLHYDGPTVRYAAKRKREDEATGNQETSPLGDIGARLEERAEKSVPAQYREDVVKLARAILGSALNVPVAEGVAQPEPLSDQAA